MVKRKPQTMSKLKRQLVNVRKKIKAQKAKMKKSNIPIRRNKKKTTLSKTKGKTVRVDKYQTPKTRKSIASDRKRKAKAPGRRISKSGRKYTEHRQNRSDKKGTLL